MLPVRGDRPAFRRGLHQSAAERVGDLLGHDPTRRESGAQALLGQVPRLRTSIRGELSMHRHKKPDLGLECPTAAKAVGSPMRARSVMAHGVAAAPRTVPRLVLCRVASPTCPPEGRAPYGDYTRGVVLGGWSMAVPPKATRPQATGGTGATDTPPDSSVRATDKPGCEARRTMIASYDDKP